MSKSIDFCRTNRVESVVSFKSTNVQQAIGSHGLAMYQTFGQYFTLPSTFNLILPFLLG